MTEKDANLLAISEYVKLNLIVLAMHRTSINISQDVPRYVYVP